MENNGAIIKFSDEDYEKKDKRNSDTHITIKGGTDDVTLFHNIINILSWSEQVNGTNSQQIMDWIKSKNFFSEFVYNPPV